MSTAAPVRVVIVDDSPDMVVILKAVLADDRFEIVGVAVNGVEALELWTRLGRSGVDAWVLDHRMPGPTGVDVATKVMADDPNQRIILLSAQLDDSLRDTAARLRLLAILDKDAMFSVPDLLVA